uniref:Uncharacterized protein n=1 Tax=Hyaloperonospora arabidopsidis (strain Emoy2) TaxID=559515 RepID=M4BM59_HYAAE
MDHTALAIPMEKRARTTRRKTTDRLVVSHAHITRYETSLDFRRNVTGEDLHLTGWYNYFPSVNSTYCEPTDEACGRCHDLVQTGRWTNQSFDWHDTDRNVSMDVMRHFCEGIDGCICVMACEADNWEANMPPACGNEGIASNNDKKAASEGVTSYSSMLIFYLVLQVTLLAVFMYKRGICRRMTGPLPPPPRPEGPYNNVNAISCPSNRLRLSGWRKIQSALIEREKKQRAFVSQQPQCIGSPRVEGAPVQTEDSYNQTLSLSSHVSPQDSGTARAAYVEVQDYPIQGQNSCFSGAMQAADVGDDVVVNEASCVETRAEDSVPRTDCVSSCVAILSTSSRNVAS